MKVVDDARVETDVRVDDQRGSEDGVNDGLCRVELTKISSRISFKKTFRWSRSRGDNVRR
jgi:hypothetical protein